MRSLPKDVRSHAFKNIIHFCNFDDILKTFFTKYSELVIVKEPKKDQFGRVDMSEEIIDEWEARTGIASIYFWRIFFAHKKKRNHTYLL